MRMKRPPPLNLHDALDEPIQQEDDEHAYHMGSTSFRQEGISIGADYLRLEGKTVTRGSLMPSSLRVIGPLGKGACSVVLKAEWILEDTTKKIVALKQFPLHVSRERRNMLLKELTALCRVECDCLMALVGAFLDQDMVTLVLEYFDCGSLHHVVRHNILSNRFPFPQQVLAAVSYQLSWGLGYLHHENMLHRDIKPGNVLLHSDGRVNLSDFGLASIRSEAALNTTMVGTTRYMAPERLRAQPYGSASDVWSLGLLLLELATGQIPWHEANSMVELIITIEDTLSSPGWIPLFVPSGLKELVRACLQREPEKRMPAQMLSQSPWFASMGIACVEDAVRIMQRYHGTVNEDSDS